MNSSQYIKQKARDFALYVIQGRAVPSIIDGLKPSERRIIWTAKNGQKYKTATLGGAVMAIHPHGETDDVISKMAAPYVNNIPFFNGEGAFGTMLDPKSYGASRYTFVTLSEFSKDVILKDIEIIPLQETYDNQYMEPVYFLPIIPISLINPIDGIMPGFNVSILPRDIVDVIKCQINHLKGKDFKEPLPNCYPYNSKSEGLITINEGKKTEKQVYYFKSVPERIGNLVKVKNLPYGLLHSDFIKHINTLKEESKISDFEDNSRDTLDITIKLVRNNNLTEDDIIKLLKLETKINERLMVLNFDHQRVLATDVKELIKSFTDWRFQQYSKRYEHLINESQKQLQKYLDFKIAYTKKLNHSQKVFSRKELVEYANNLKIVNIDYIVDMPIHRFTEENFNKNEKNIVDEQEKLKYYNSILEDSEKRKQIYIDELNEILGNFKKGKYK